MPELSINKKNIADFFTDIQKNSKKFIIPDYQRAYEWDEDKCQKLWEDLIDFYNDKSFDNYFLGTIVSYKNEKNIKEIEIIDGQQRITTIFLLLRAIYTHLEGQNQESPNVRGLKQKIEPCIWYLNEITGLIEDKANIIIETRVALDEHKQCFLEILMNGETEIINNNYSKNYLFFCNLIRDLAMKEPMAWENFVISILNKVIIFPIECDSEGVALTIFSTLNDRGLPLYDTDIFKAKIYKSIDNDNGKKAFIEKWKELTEDCKDAKINLGDLFRYYTHIIRSQEKITKSEEALKTFYTDERLKKENLISDLYMVANFWIAINNQKKAEKNYLEYINLESRKYLHCLSYYPNEYWKYITTVYFYYNRNNVNFVDDFSIFLKKLTAFLYLKFIYSPTVNAVKNSIYLMMIDIKNNLDLSQLFKNQLKDNEKNTLNKELINPTSTWKINKGLILLNSYLNNDQNNLIIFDFDIEHIFPRKWQNTNYNGWNRDDAEKYLEMYGNKIVLEKKLNIQAGNNYFGKKKLKYKESNIADVIKLSNYPSDDWNKDDIEKRNNEVINNLILFFNDNLDIIF